eukprot:scaffold32657_cov31-Tisochrysis_lutea.AAC.1
MRSMNINDIVSDRDLPRIELVNTIYIDAIEIDASFLISPWEERGVACRRDVHADKQKGRDDVLPPLRPSSLPPRPPGRRREKKKTGEMGRLVSSGGANLGGR